MTTGLTLGKFAPFHRGHQFVVERALAAVDHLVVVVYDCPATTAVPLTVRADWIRDLYPDVEVLEAWTAPTETGYDDVTKARQERALLDVLDGREIDTFYSSEPYGKHVSDALGAEDCRVDPDRETVPISGTAIRDSPYVHREFVDERVYRDLVTNVVLLGGPSTGKTTLARALAAAFDTEWMPEYGREYWAANQVDGTLTREQLVELAEEHLARERRRLTEANKYLFTDTNAITTLLFSRRYHGDAAPRLKRLARQCGRRYDHVIVCDDDIPYDDAGGRAGEVWRERMQKQTLAYLDRNHIPYTVVSGPVDTRIERVECLLEGTTQYDHERDP